MVVVVVVREFELGYLELGVGLGGVRCMRIRMIYAIL